MTARVHQAPVSGAQQEQPFDSTAGFRSTPLYPHAGSGAIDGAGTSDPGDECPCEQCRTGRDVSRSPHPEISQRMAQMRRSW